MYDGIIELKILNVTPHKSTTEGKINEILADGWILLDIATMAPSIIPGGQGSKSNYVTYHFGKKAKAEKKHF